MDSVSIWTEIFHNANNEKGSHQRWSKPERKPNPTSLTGNWKREPFDWNVEPLPRKSPHRCVRCLGCLDVYSACIPPLSPPRSDRKTPSGMQNSWALRMRFYREIGRLGRTRCPRLLLYVAGWSSGSTDQLTALRIVFPSAARRENNRSENNGA